RLEDLSPLVDLLPDSSWAERWAALAPRGEVTDLELVARRDDGVYDYSISTRFDRLGAAPSARVPGFAGLSGELRADAASGRVAFDTTDARIDWPALFRAPIDVDALTGLIVWREGADALRIVSDDLTLANADAAVRSSLELTLPREGGGASLDLATEIDTFEAVAAKRYLPVHKMPRRAVEWLDDALQGGTVTGAQLSFVGPLAAFPFDGGEGTFRAT